MLYPNVTLPMFIDGKIEALKSMEGVVNQEWPSSPESES